MNTRIKQIRLALNLDQDAFAKSIGISKSGVSALESGTRQVNNKHIRMLELTFNVNSKWLLTGEGEMFNSDNSSLLLQLKQKYCLSDIEMQLVEHYLNLPQSKRNEFTNILISISSKHQ